MKLELTPASPEDVPTGPPAMRTQRSGRIVAVLDGDAHLHVWQPNVGADRIDIDLTKTVALVIDLGVDAPPAPRPHWTDSDDSMTLIVSLEAGADGVITVDGHRISEDAAVSLAADGFVRLLRDAVADRPGLDPEDHAEHPAKAADTPLDAAGAGPVAHDADPTPES